MRVGLRAEQSCLIREGDRGGDQRAAVDRALYSEPAVQGSQPIVQAQQALTTGPRSSRADRLLTRS